MRIIFGLLMLVTAMAIELPRVTADAADDQKKLDGNWKVKSATVAGITMPAKEREKVRVVFDGKKLSFLGTPDGDKHTTYKVDPSKTPAMIDIAPPPGEKKDALGIYEFAGTTLTLCFSEGGESRPADFKDTKRAIVLVLEKAE